MRVKARITHEEYCTMCQYADVDKLVLYARIYNIDVSYDNNACARILLCRKDFGLKGCHEFIRRLKLKSNNYLN